MVRNTVLALLLSFLLFVGAVEVGYTINGSYAASAVLSAGAMTALFLSMAKITGDEMAGRDEGSGVMKAKGFWGEVTFPATATNAIILVLAIALGLFLWQHHTESVEWSKKIFSATERNTRAIIIQTYVSTLSPERKAQLNLDVPEELRPRYREP